MGEGGWIKRGLTSKLSCMGRDVADYRRETGNKEILYGMVTLLRWEAQLRGDIGTNERRNMWDCVHGRNMGYDWNSYVVIVFQCSAVRRPSLLLLFYSN